MSTEFDAVSTDFESTTLVAVRRRVGVVTFVVSVQGRHRRIRIWAGRKEKDKLNSTLNVQ